MKLYELAMTPSARRVNIFLNELGIELARESLNLRAGDNLSDEFKAISINGRIPVLELDDGQTLCESMAICRYFDELNPAEHSLFGNTPLEKAQVEMWQRICELQGLFVAFQAFRNITKIYQDRERCVEAWGEESRQRVIEFLPTLEKQLSKQPYVAGEHFSVADITAYVMMSFIKNLEITPSDEQPHIKAWLNKMEQRPSIIAVNG
ncbi:glutathione S-transferase [Shewanella psychrotolerans]|uniref:glutathione S-transferase n=1 Tax=Shewanella psychrotolerans TaxID=2864206 RepID=UPI001C65CE1D|nr:glutathione S-transferase [Shewanella psychrotolerans]QYK00417.1 glutathione S-transferase [Shewanella psychrotolerans]